jgi:hypothetical protein
LDPHAKTNPLRLRRIAAADRRTELLTLKALAVALGTLSVVSTPASVRVNDAVVNYLRPVLKYVGGAARVNYAGVCPGSDKLLLPDVAVQPAPQGTAGITAVRQIFRNDPQVSEMQDQSGMLRITIGTVSTTVLQTRIPSLTLSPSAQYTPRDAVYAIAMSANNYAKEHGLNFGIAETVLDIIARGPAKGAPHLPPIMKNVTVDEALNSVANTFKGIVLYGSCKKPDGKELFRSDYIDGS